jgi:hypothetical protein
VGHHETGAIVAKGDFVVNSVGASPKSTMKYKNYVLHFPVDAHGGVARWNRLKMAKASVSITGAIWPVKGKPDVLKDISIEASATGLSDLRSGPSMACVGS